MGRPFEIRITGDSHNIESQTNLSINRIQASAAPPLLSLQSEPGPDHPFAWISGNGYYKSWYNQRRPQLLYLHSGADIQSASEYIFYDLGKSCGRGEQIAIYFTFDRLQCLGQDEKWPSQRRVVDIFGTPERVSFDSVIPKVLDDISEDSSAFCVLAWVLYAVRPPTIWELATILNSTSSPVSAAIIETLLQRWLPGLVSLRQGEVVIKTPRIREILMTELTQNSGKSRLAGRLNPKKAHGMIAKFCVDYLSSPTVISDLEGLYNAARTIDPPKVWVTDRTNLQDYATRFWLHHLVLSSHAQVLAGSPGIDLMAFHETGAAAAWLQASWVLSHPLARNEHPFESLYPALAGIGLADEAERWCTGDSDVSAALVVTCTHGSLQSIRSLLPRVNHSTQSLQQALILAGVYCDEAAWLELIRLIHEGYPEFPWKSQELLVSQASWLVLNKALLRLLELGCPANPRTRGPPYGWPLHYAIESHNRDGAMILLQHGVDPKHIDPRNKWTLVQYAAFHGDPDIIKLLASQGVGPDAADISSPTAIYVACVKGNFKAVEVLVTLGADVNLKTKTQNQAKPAWSPLTAAIDERNVNCTRALLKAANINLNIVGVEGTPLSYAIDHGLLGICRDLLDSGVDPNYHPESPPLLIRAVTRTDPRNRIEAIKLLLAKKARDDDTDHGGDTPLLCACRPTNAQPLSTVAVLLAHGADVNHLNQQGFAPLHIAIACGHVGLVKILLEAGASPNLNILRILADAGGDINQVNETVSRPGGSPLLSLFSDFFKPVPEEARDEILDVLLNAGADTATLSGIFFGTVGAAAAFNGSHGHINKLFSHGADFTAADSMGRSPLHLAALRGELSIFNSILAVGGPANARDKCGRSVVSWAAQGGNIEILHKACQLIGNEAINEPDQSGWTPLFWAARGVGKTTRPSNNQRQVVLHLLRRGADITAKSNIKGKEFTPESIAIYHNYKVIARDLARYKASSKPDDSIAQQGASSPHRNHFVENDDFRGYCLFDCYGIMYTCQVCMEFCLCYKCYSLKDNTHPSGRVFKSRGEEPTLRYESSEGNIGTDKEVEFDESESSDYESDESDSTT
ncbi:putative zinc ZZ-type [Rosellinia necatrix]|uniref:Putative zinc ZZ-type n=1 Tax=Rosellinia necatrix TaxID=77044 RepID=A0A1S8A704_ROSNE|nr:putative zinc ZZ-type [Rosellinia necatrix]